MNPLRDSILALLDGWAAGTQTNEAVRDRAEELLEGQPEDSLDAQPDLQEALLQLSLMHHQLIVNDDIPAVRALVEGDSPVASRLSAWYEYSNSIDLTARANQLSGNQLYEPGVAAVLRLP